MKLVAPAPWRTLSGGSTLSDEALRLGLMKPSPRREIMVTTTSVQNTVLTSAWLMKWKPIGTDNRP